VRPTIFLDTFLTLAGASVRERGRIELQFGLPECPASGVDGRSHVEALSSALAAFGTAARKGIGQATELGDLDTADLFTEGPAAASTSGCGSSRRISRRNAEIPCRVALSGHLDRRIERVRRPG
jgi:hypothetical protein